MAIDYSSSSYTSYNPQNPVILPPVQGGSQPAPAVPSFLDFSRAGTPQPETQSAPSVNPWFIDSSGNLLEQGKSVESDDSWIDKVWDWAQTDQGVSVLGGALGGISDMYSAELGNDASKELLQMRLDAEERMQARALAASEAVLKNARIGRHNTSINKPISLRLKK